MSVGLLLVTHEGIGAQLSQVAREIFCQTVEPVAQIAVPSDLQPEILGRYADSIRDAINAQDNGDGVLVMTDVYGATPDNLARYFAANCNAQVVSGINLPMLLRVLNYAHLSLEQLCETAITGGTTGVTGNDL